MKADVSNYDANIAKARKTLDGFRQDNLTLGGIINQSTKSVVAAAAQYASFAAVIGTVAAGFSEAASRGIELSREAEGVSKAFDRLNKPGLLDNLRQATHNTVSDLELMKQAVKFDNFNLSLEQMGTFLAFAQQQAKDTGQDVNYLVDSIVTGLGRKSLPILDNLGLSATDIKERMKQTGDMTQAVAQIIEERMSKAGDYVETASDRAAKAQVKLDNAMKELGDTMNSLTGAGATLWTDLKVGAIDLANTAIKPLIKLFNELAEYINGPSVESILTKGMTDVTDTVDDNGRLIRKDAISSIPEIVVSGTKPKKKTTKTGTTKTEVITQGDMNDLWLKMLGTADTLKIDDNRYFQSVHGMLGDKGLRQMLGISAPAFDLGRDISEKDYKKLPGYDKNKDRDEKKLTEQISKLTSGISSITGGIKAMGFNLPNEVEQVIGVVQGVMAVIEGVNSVISIFGSTSMALNTIALDANTAALWAVAGTNLIPGLARGGIVPHAAGGYLIPGNNYSGDNVFAGGAWVNSGELVLSKAQQGNLASQLSGSGLQNLHLEASVHGEQIVLAVNNTMKRKNKGELATFR